MSAVKDAVNNLAVATISQAGPASYATGGFLVDFTATHSWLGFVLPTISVIGVLPDVEYEIATNVDASGAEAFGKAVVKLVRQRYQQGSSGAVSGQPGGVTVQASLTANTATTHTHSINHDHGVVTSGPMIQLGNGSTAATSPDSLGHTHDFTIPPLSANTPAGGSHSHNRAFEYDHNHPVTTAATDVSLTEIAASTNLSGVTFKVTGFGFGKV